MSAVADLINKLLRQRCVYFQGLDLRAKISGVGFSQIPHIHSRNHTHMYSECDARSLCSMIWWALLDCVLFGIFVFFLSKKTKQRWQIDICHGSSWLFTGNISQMCFIWGPSLVWRSLLPHCHHCFCSSVLSLWYQHGNTKNTRIMKNLTFKLRWNTWSRVNLWAPLKFGPASLVSSTVPKSGST